jgi:hypothetical protein
MLRHVVFVVCVVGDLVNGGHAEPTDGLTYRANIHQGGDASGDGLEGHPERVAKGKALNASRSSLNFASAFFFLTV